jgi:hypothetical protein
MLERKCDTCEADSDWVCRKCYHHVALVCGTYEQQRDSFERASRKVIDVWRDADAMLAYLRGDPTQLHAAIGAMASVLNYKAQSDE